MKPELTWLASSSASCLHVAEILRRGDAIDDPALSSAVEHPITMLKMELDSVGVKIRPFWRHVVPLSAGIENDQELVDVVLRKIGGGAPDASTRIAGRIRDLKLAFKDFKPNLTDELAQRGGPIRTQWEARGPGLLRQFADLTGDQLLVETAQVILVQPCRGGACERTFHTTASASRRCFTIPSRRCPKWCGLPGDWRSLI
ncbi:MAG: hypothetical protein ACIALR_06700 [Blastopirellula sp. JB062]